MAMPSLKYNLLKQSIKPKAPKSPPFKIHPNIVLIILLVVLFAIVLALGFLVWRVYKVRSRVKGFKPMARLFSGNVDDLEESISQLLSLIKNPVSHVAKALLQPTSTPSTPSASPALKAITKPRPPPRMESLPKADLELTKQVAVSEETLQDIVQELEQTEPKFKGYKKYLAKKTRTNTVEDEV